MVSAISVVDVHLVVDSVYSLFKQQGQELGFAQNIQSIFPVETPGLVGCALGKNKLNKLRRWSIPPEPASQAQVVRCLLSVQHTYIYILLNYIISYDIVLY